MLDESLLVDFDLLVPPASRRILELQKQQDAQAVASLALVDEEVDLRANDSPIRQQDGPRCTAWAVVAAIENLLKGAVDLSEMHLFSLQHGSQNIEAAVHAAGQWIAIEDDWWRNGRCRLSASQYVGYDWDRLVAAIRAGRPLVVGFRTPRLLGGQSAVIEADTGVASGGHAVAVVGFRVRAGRRYFLVKNSWGKQGDERGYYWIAWDLYSGADTYNYALFYECGDAEDRLAGWALNDAGGLLSVGAHVRSPLGVAEYRITEISGSAVKLSPVSAPRE